ncbi:hypothetical protein (nucleomorph) [Guillardia theta]|uniref:Kinetochore protein NDC80 n=1 Tax=Guillardia theta TaxID=55529 RepID=Q98S64_GUITH|nr:hypothetical protein GTHECHR3074 [Guillardia theta]AAK39718.1 hypothetical protein [Guillardia theta]
MNKIKQGRISILPNHKYHLNEDNFRLKSKLILSGFKKYDSKKTNEENFISKSLKKIDNFLKRFCYNIKIDKKMFRYEKNIGLKIIIIKMIMILDYNCNLSTNLAFDYYKILKTLGYPFEMSIFSFSSKLNSRTVLSVITSLIWLTELIRYDIKIRQFFCNLKEKNAIWNYFELSYRCFLTKGSKYENFFSIIWSFMINYNQQLLIYEELLQFNIFQTCNYKLRISIHTKTEEKNYEFKKSKNMIKLNILRNDFSFKKHIKLCINRKFSFINAKKIKNTFLDNIKTNNFTIIKILEIKEIKIDKSWLIKIFKMEYLKFFLIVIHFIRINKHMEYIIMSIPHQKSINYFNETFSFFFARIFYSTYYFKISIKFCNEIMNGQKNIILSSLFKTKNIIYSKILNSSNKTYINKVYQLSYEFLDCKKIIYSKKENKFLKSVFFYNKTLRKYIGIYEFIYVHFYIVILSNIFENSNKIKTQSFMV